MGSTLDHMENALGYINDLDTNPNIHILAMLKDQLENAISHYKIEKKLPPYDREDEKPISEIMGTTVDEYMEKKKNELTFEEQRHGRFANDTRESRT